MFEQVKYRGFPTNRLLLFRTFSLFRRKAEEEGRGGGSGFIFETAVVKVYTCQCSLKKTNNKVFTIMKVSKPS